MARVIRFSGLADHSLQINGARGEEPVEVPCYDDLGAVRITTPDGEGLIVVGVYALPTMPTQMPYCWSIGLCPLDRQKPMPSWIIDWEFRGATPVLTVHPPDDAIVEAIT